MLRRNTHETMIIMMEPRTMPSKGEITINATVLITPAVISELVPDFAIAAPINPPISACDDEDGIP